MGVTCIKTDFGENIHMDAVYKGMKPEPLNNLYALLYQKAAYEITKEVTGDWHCSGHVPLWAGCQRYPLHWGGDSCSSWMAWPVHSKEACTWFIGLCLLETMMSPDSIPCPIL